MLLRRISPLYMSGPDRCIQNFKSNLVDKVFLRPLVIALQLFRQRFSQKRKSVRDNADWYYHNTNRQCRGVERVWRGSIEDRDRCLPTTKDKVCIYLFVLFPSMPLNYL